jgi:DNA-binding NarL/FixJ family response regulator
MVAEVGIARANGACRNGYVPAVLIVDDDASVRELLRELLERDGRLAVAGEARDGRDAVVAAERLRPDAVIIDHQMPGMTGLQALPVLRRRAPSAVMVMLSGAPIAELGALAVAAGADAYFQKGSGLFEVVGSLVRLLESADPIAPAA